MTRTIRSWEMDLAIRFVIYNSTPFSKGFLFIVYKNVKKSSKIIKLIFLRFVRIRAFFLKLEHISSRLVPYEKNSRFRRIIFDSRRRINAIVLVILITLSAPNGHLLKVSRE